MSRNKPSITQSAPVIASKKTRSPSAPAARLSHARHLEAEKQALQALEQSLRLQAYTIGLPRSQPLFSGNDQRRPVFPSAPVHIIRLLKSK
jgi:hypothetical protein